LALTVQGRHQGGSFNDDPAGGLQYVEDNVPHFYRFAQPAVFGGPQLNLAFTPVPEPSTMAVLIAGGIVVSALHRNRRTPR
jgi:hypothetical protein